VADPLRDLRLGHVLDEAQVQDQPLALRQVREGGVERDFALDQLEALVLAADPLRGRRFVGIVGVGRAVERERPAVVVGLEHLEHLGLLQVEPPGDLADRGRALKLLGQLGHRLADLGDAVVQTARHAHRPDAVAEMALQLAEDGRRGEGGEGDAALGVEAVDRVHQPQARHLEKVVEGLVRAAVALGEAFREGQVAPHELLARRGVARPDEVVPEPLLAGEVLLRPGGQRRDCLMVSGRHARV
jgi:hypothetical protein